ncbi:hypothetical protein A3O11_01380 [Ligilactobacillus aviarius]|uniref:hypothetical protein n=1 Tax=Ligilactobacillus aviarius TaxID=1606 RepID=UPI0007D8F49A|nr:hypothetical protein [Ligilactobacillus aviarius]OAQ01931.1 hypothetical protein A3O11_01380 [Ligilactobacillus aviarius]OAQ03443.1 hypothetical protein A3O10_06150 [Ligilactobacillus aviarius]OAS81254.1 hypothetical protein A3O18_02845 [Ligilactobacillus aviarius]PEG71130.1 hypothetical protein A3P04_02700 [Ligilactobacillus aviarius]PEG74387.1 hypothetical protein A3O82_01305 [Ligilactobacillus aviarius]
MRNNKIKSTPLTMDEINKFNQSEYLSIRKIKTPKNAKFDGIEIPQTIEKTILLKRIVKKYKRLGMIPNIFSFTPFIKEEQLYASIMTEGRISNELHNQVKSLLRLMRYLNILVKYEYQINLEKNIAYILVDSDTLVSLYNDKELRKTRDIISIPEFNRRMIMEWENASRILNKIGEAQIQARLRNLKGTPTIFLEHQNHPYALMFGSNYSQQAYFVENHYGIPVFIPYYPEQVNEQPLRGIKFQDLNDENVQNWFGGFQFDHWNENREKRLAEKERKQKHPFLSKFGF